MTQNGSDGTPLMQNPTLSHAGAPRPGRKNAGTSEYHTQTMTRPDTWEPDGTGKHDNGMTPPMTGVYSSSGPRYPRRKASQSCPGMTQANGGTSR